MEPGRRRLRTGLAALALAACALEISSETINMTTYYPSPLGIYRKIVTTTETILNKNGGNTLLVPASNPSGKVGVGTADPQAKLDVAGTLRVGNFPADPPGGVDGAIYYNSSSGKFRGFQAGAWKDLAGGGPVVVLDNVAADVSVWGRGAWPFLETLYSFPVSGGTLGTSSRLRLQLYGTLSWGTTPLSTLPLIVRLQYGGAVVASAGISQNTGNVGAFSVTAILDGHGASNAQTGSISTAASPPFAAGPFGWGSAAIDGTVGQTLAVVLDFTNVNDGLTVTMQHAVLEKLE